nr:hypothetical protein [Desulfobacula sp.]
MQFKTFLRSGLLIFLGMTILVLLLFINLPLILESQIQRKLPDIFQTSGLDFSIQKIGFSNALISKIKTHQGLSIDFIRFDYSLGPIKGLVIDKMTVSGLNLKAGPDENNRFHMKGFSFPDTLKSGSETREPEFPAFLPSRIIVKNSRIVISALNEEFLIPFEMISNFRRKEKKIMIQASIHPFGETLISNLTYDLKHGVEFVRVEGKSLDLEHLAPYIPKNIKEMNLRGAVDLRLESFSPEKEWQLDISRLGLVKPADMALEEIKAGILIDERIIRAAGTFKLAHPLLSENEIKYDLKIDTAKTLASEFSLNSGPLTVKAPAADISFPEVRVFGNVSMDENRVPRGRILIKSSQGKVQSKPYKLILSGLSFEFPMHFPDFKENPPGKFSVSSVIYNDHYAFSTTGDILQSGAKKFKVSSQSGSKLIPRLRQKSRQRLILKKKYRPLCSLKQISLN